MTQVFDTHDSNNSWNVSNKASEEEEAGKTLDSDKVFTQDSLCKQSKGMKESQRICMAYYGFSAPTITVHLISRIEWHKADYQDGQQVHASLTTPNGNTLRTEESTFYAASNGNKAKMFVP